MADISKINLNNSIYNIKDDTSRASIAGINSTLINMSSDIDDNNTKVDNFSVDLAALSARMDTFTNLPNGSTTGDAELADARVAFDGRVYDTAGDAIRGQAKNNAVKITTPIGYEIIQNAYVNKTNGDFVTYNGWNRTNYIPIDDQHSIFIHKTAGTDTNRDYNAYYDENHGFITSFVLDTGDSELIPPLGAKYMAISDIAGFSLSIYRKRVEYEYEKIDSIIKNLMPIGIVPYSGWNQGARDANGNLSFSWRRIASDIINVTPNMKLKVKYLNTAYSCWVQEYDSQKNVVLSGNYLNDGDTLVLRPNTYFISIIAMRNDEYIKPDEAYSMGIGLTPITVDESTVITNMQFTKLRVMSYNVGHWNYGDGSGIDSTNYATKLKNLKEFFGEYQPDILCMNEFWKYLDRDGTIETDSVLFDPLYRYKYNSDFWNAIKSNFNIINNFTGKLDTNSTNSYNMITFKTFNDDLVAVMCCHFHHSDYTIQTSEMNNLISILGEYSRAIVCGDFNVTDANKETLYGLAINAGYKISNGGYFGWTPTWPANNPDENPQKWYIDNIMVKGNIDIKNFERLDVYSELCSDHLPVYSDLIIY